MFEIQTVPHVKNLNEAMLSPLFLQYQNNKIFSSPYFRLIEILNKLFLFLFIFIWAENKNSVPRNRGAKKLSQKNFTQFVEYDLSEATKTSPETAFFQRKQTVDQQGCF